MTDYQVSIWLSVVLVVELVAIFVACNSVFANEDQHLHVLQKIGFAFLVFGLVVQVVRSINYLNYGFYPVDKFFPMWITKDIGACILIYYYAFIHPKLSNGKD
jgi:hypothetical protein